MTRPRKAPRSTRPASELAAIPTAYDLATPEERALAGAIIRAIRLDLARYLAERMRAANL